MPKKIPEIIFSIFLTLLNLCVIFVITWASYRGLELSDESFYYLGYRHFDNAPDLGAASFHFIYGRFFSFLDLSLTGSRQLRLILTILSSLVLYIGVVKLKARSSWSDKFVLFNILLSGMLLSFCWAPMALSYNSMSSILIALIVGFWLLSLKIKSQGEILCWAILGGLFVLLFFIKATNILLFPLIIFAALYWRNTQGFQKRKILTPNMLNILAFLLGIVGMLFFVSGGDSISETINSHLQQLFGLANADSSHSFSYLWDKYYKNAEMVIQKLKYTILVLFAFYILARLFFKIRKEKPPFWATTVFKIAGIIIFLTFIYQNEYWKGGTPFKYKMLIPYVFVAVFAVLNQSLESKKINTALIFGLLSIPIAGAIGTNNGLSAQVLFYSVFVFLLIYYALKTSSITWFKNVSLSLIMLLATSQIVSGTILNPYRLSPLTQNTQNLDGIPIIKNLKVDSETFELSENLKSLRSFKAEYIFAYSGMLGLNSLTEKKPYSLEWFNEGDDDKICAIIGKSKISSENILFLIPEEIPLTEKIITCLEEKGIYFKSEYSKIKTFKFFYPRNNKKLTLNVYQYTAE